MNIRGRDADLVFIDEVAHAPADLIPSIVAPMITQAKTCLIAATTTAGSHNHFTRMTQIKDPVTGEFLFTTLRLGLPCEKCLKSKGEFEPCEHNQKEKPDWISSSQKRKWGHYYKAMGREDTMKEELYSIASTEGIRVYDEPDILRLCDRPVYDSSIPPKVICWGIDPSGGGKQSKYASISGFFVNGILVITSIDAGSPETGLRPDKEAYLVPIVLSVMKHKSFCDPAMVLTAEVEPGCMASEAADMFSKYKKILVLREATTKRHPGVIKTDIMTMSFKAKVSQLLREDRILFHKNMITSDFESQSAAKNALCEQLRNYMIWTENGKIRISGKQFGPDDIAVALGHLVEGAVTLMNRTDDPMYNEFKCAYGLV